MPLGTPTSTSIVMSLGTSIGRELGRPQGTSLEMQLGTLLGAQVRVTTRTLPTTINIILYAAEMEIECLVHPLQSYQDCNKKGINLQSPTLKIANGKRKGTWLGSKLGVILGMSLGSLLPTEFTVEIATVPFTIKGTALGTELGKVLGVQLGTSL